MWIRTNFGALNLKNVSAAVVDGNSIRVFCVGSLLADAEIPFGTNVQADEAYTDLVARLRRMRRLTGKD